MNADIISLVVAIIALVSTIVIAIAQYKQSKKIDERDEKRRKELIYLDATRFILKYSASNHESDIYLLPLCIIAYKYNSIYPYNREIYREFCSLTEETQNHILERCKIDIPCFRADSFYEDMLKKLKNTIKVNYPNDRDLYYDGGKYFERALLHHGNVKVPEITCSADQYHKDSLKMVPTCQNEDSMDYKFHILNLLAYEKDKAPIAHLMHENTSMGVPTESDEILISYLSCIIAKYTSIYSYNKQKFENIGYVDDYQGSLYMEDLFLDALFNIYVFNF